MLRFLVAFGGLAAAWAASDWGETLIVAANQRILCQKMTKELILIAQDVNADKAKADIQDSMAQFETDMLALTLGDPDRHILEVTNDIVKKDLLKVMETWVVFKALLLQNIDTVRDSDTGEVNVTVVNLALEYNKDILKYSEEVVSLLVAESVVAGEDGSEAQVVDVCERQMMLIHEVNEEAVLIALGIDPEYYREKVLSAMQLFLSSHEGILRGATWTGVPPLRNACILDQMRVVTKDWGAVLPKLQMITTAPSIEESQEKSIEIAMNLTYCCDQLVASMSAATYSIAHGVTTCGDLKAAVSREEWMIAVQSAEKQNYLVAKATQLFLQIALGFEVSQSQVDLTVLTESLGQDLRKLIEGDMEESLVVPPDQDVVDLLFNTQTAWVNLETELKKAVRSSEVPSTSIKEVARLSRLALDNIGEAVKLYVKVALSSGTTAPVYLIDIASAQRSALAKLAKETSLLSYGYDPQNSWIRFNETRRKFVASHWKLLKGYPAGEYPAVPKTTNICVVQQMAIVLEHFELLELAALDVANGKGAVLAEVVQLTPKVVDEMEVAMNQYGGFNTTCGEVHYSKEQWQGLISEVGQLRSLSQLAAVRFILRNEFNQSTVSLRAALQESELRIQYGSRDPLVPPPISQEMFDEVAVHLEPKLQKLRTALEGTDSKKVSEASIVLREELKLVKKEFLTDASASNPDMPVLRMDLASQQIMLAYQIFKESLLLKANLNSTTTSISSSIETFETSQQHLKTGGNGIPAVIRNRFDIFKQWDEVQASWTVFKELILSSNADIGETNEALDNLVVHLQTALELYTIPDEPLRADTTWPIIAYSAIGTFVMIVGCCACCLFCSLRKPKTKADGTPANVPNAASKAEV